MNLSGIFEKILPQTAPIGLDLGSRYVRVSLPGKKKLVIEPAVVAKNIRSDRIVAIGSAAEKITGRTPDHIQTIYPIAAGEVEDSDALEALISILLYREIGGLGQIFGRKILVSLPVGVTDVSARIIKKTLEQARARTVRAIPASVAGLVGVGAPVGDPTTQFICNVGYGITQIAAVSDGSLIAEASTTLAGAQLDDRIRQFILDEYGIRISASQAQNIKHMLGAVRGWSENPGETLSVSGQDEASSLPREITLSRIDVAEALEPLAGDLLEFIRGFVSSLSEDMAADLSAHGLHLIGGSANLTGLADYINDELGVAVHTRVSPDKIVIEGVSYVANRQDENNFTQSIDTYESTN